MQVHGAGFVVIDLEHARVYQAAHFGRSNLKFSRCFGNGHYTTRGSGCGGNGCCESDGAGGEGRERPSAWLG